MIDQHAYEVEGLRDNGETFAVEILGTVNLLLVPFIHAGSASWSEEQVQLFQQLPPTVSEKLS